MTTSIQRTLAGLASATILFAGGCGNVPDANVVFEQLADASRIAADTQVDFTRASDAANRAVMADTAERAVAAAAESRQAFEAVQKDTAALAPILDLLTYADEATILQQFRSRLAQYQTLEENILGLAVKSTNVKARQLSFGPAQEAADALPKSLDALAPASPSEAWHVKALTASAIAAVRDIQALHAPHIAEATDDGMARLEKRMTASAAAARGALEQLRPLVTPASRPRLDAAVETLDRFMKTNTEILDLSRQNTNVRSVALSLEQKRALIAPCEESLAALRQALDKRRQTRRP